LVDIAEARARDGCEACKAFLDSTDPMTAPDWAPRPRAETLAAAGARRLANFLAINMSTALGATIAMWRTAGSDVHYDLGNRSTLKMGKACWHNDMFLSSLVEGDQEAVRRNIIGLRLVHARVSVIHGGERPDPETTINADMFMAVLMGLFELNLIGMEIIGLDVDPKEWARVAEVYRHAWWMLGVREDVARGFLRDRAMMRKGLALSLRRHTKGKSAHLLVRNFIEFVASELGAPMWLWHPIHAAGAALILGEDHARDAGLKSTFLGTLLLHPFLNAVLVITLISRVFSTISGRIFAALRRTRDEHMIEKYGYPFPLGI